MCNWIGDSRKQRGAVLLVAIVILVVLLFLGASLIERADNSLARASTDNRSAQSFYRAEAGIDKAVFELKQETGWQTYNGETGVNLGQGKFDVTVAPAASARPSHVVATVDAIGYQVGGDGAHRLPRRIRTLIKRNEVFPFKYAIAAMISVDIGNSQIDSFRSEDGPYGGANVRSQAGVAVNTKTIAEGGVAIGANGVLDGPILLGAGTNNIAGGVNIQGTHNGTTGVLEAPMTFAPVAIPAGATDLGAVNITGGTLTLSPGIYRASSISITGNGSLEVTGNVTIYVDGNIDIAGKGMVNADPGKPRNMKIKGTQNCTSVRVHGASTFYGGVYAPNATIALQESITAGEIFGSFVGKQVKLMGSQTRFHYDEDLAFDAEGGVQVCSWQEL